MSGLQIRKTEIDIQSLACCFPIKASPGADRNSVHGRAGAEPLWIQAIKVAATLLLIAALLIAVTKVESARIAPSGNSSGRSVQQ